MMKKVLLSIHIVVLIIAAGALIGTYFIAADKIDTIIQVAFWLVVVSSVLGIINFQTDKNKEQNNHV